MTEDQKAFIAELRGWSDETVTAYMEFWEACAKWIAVAETAQALKKKGKQATDDALMAVEIAQEEYAKQQAAQAALEAMNPEGEEIYRVYNEAKAVLEARLLAEGTSLEDHLGRTFIKTPAGQERLQAARAAGAPPGWLPTPFRLKWTPAAGPLADAGLDGDGSQDLSGWEPPAGPRQ